MLKRQAVGVFCGKEGLKVKNRLLNNLGWKILSLFIAIILWVIVTTISNPSISKSFSDIPVSLTNSKDLVQADKQVYEILDGETVTVTIAAPRSVISELKKEDIIVTADVEKSKRENNDSYVTDSEGNYLIGINVKINSDYKYGKEITKDNINVNINAVKIKVEQMAEKSLPIQVIPKDKPAEDHRVTEITPDSNIVTIKGAKSVIDTVVSAKAEVDVAGFNSDINSNAEIKFFDANDKQINIKKLKITANISSVRIAVDIQKEKEIPVVLTLEDEENFAAKGYGVTRYGINSEGALVDKIFVKIYGEPEAVNRVSEIRIPLRKDANDVKSESYSEKIDIMTFVPSDVTLDEGVSKEIDYTVEIVQKSQNRLRIEKNAIALANVPDGYTCSVPDSEENREIVVWGLNKTMVAGVTFASLKAVVDINKWLQDEGIDPETNKQYSIPVAVYLPDGVTLYEPFSVAVEFVKNN